MKTVPKKIAIVAGIVAILGVIGRMDYSDRRQVDAYGTAELRQRLIPVAAKIPPPKPLCFAPGSAIESMLKD